MQRTLCGNSSGRFCSDFLWSQIKKSLLFSLEVKLGGEGVASSQPLDGAAVGLDVDHVAHFHALLLQGKQKTL